MKAEDFLNQGTKPAKEGLPSKGMSAEAFLNMPAEEPIAPEPITEPAAEPGFAQGLYEQGKGAVSEFFRPSFAPEPTVPVGMEGMPESAIPAGMPEDIVVRRDEVNKRLGQLDTELQESAKVVPESFKATTGKLDALQAQLEKITSQAVDNALPPDLYEQYTALRPQYEKAFEDYNASVNAFNLTDQTRVGTHNALVTEAQGLTGELEDLKQMEYGAEMARPISTITGEPVPTPEERMPGGITEPGKFDFMDRAREIKEEGVVPFVPFVSGAKEVKDIARVSAAAYKLKEGTASPEEKTDLLEFVEKANRDTTFGYKVINTVAAMPAFMGEFLLTSGLYSAGRKIGTKTATKALENYMGKAGRKVLEKDLGKIGVGIVGGVAGGTLQAPIMGAPRIVSGTIERSMPKLKLSRDEEGGINAVIAGEGEDLLVAFTMALGDQWAETVSEHSGGLFRMLNGSAKNAAIRAGLFSATMKVNPGMSPNKVNTLFNKMAYHGVINEMLEERVGEGLRAGLGLQEYKIPTAEQLAVELVSFSVPGVIQVLGARAFRGPEPTEVPPTAPPTALGLSETQRELAKEVIREKMAEQPLPPAIPEEPIPTVSPMEITPGVPPVVPEPMAELPPGQGFELIEPIPETRLRPGPEKIAGPEYPEGVEYVAGKPAPEEFEVEHKPILGSHGLPWKKKENALKAFESKRLIEAGITEETHEVVPVKNGFGITKRIEKVVIEKEKLFPKIKDNIVDGRTVGEKIPNTDSISATLTNYEEMPGIREISMDEIEVTDSKELFYAADDIRHVKKLADEIKESDEIKPLIVVQDIDGLYILEGAHRLGALHTIGAKSFPALVVRDLESLEKAREAKEEIVPEVEIPEKPVVEKPSVVKEKPAEVPMSSELKELHEHKARTLGFEKAGGSFVEGYLKKLAKVAEKTDMPAAMAVYEALSEYKKGNINQASLEAEKILGKLHKAEKEALMPKPKEPVAEASAKEPWEMTQNKWVDGHIKSPAMHREHVRQVLKSGKLTPEKYAELHKKDYGPLGKFMPEVIEKPKPKVVPEEIYYSGTEKGKPTGKYLYLTKDRKYAENFGPDIREFRAEPKNTLDLTYLGERAIGFEKLQTELKNKDIIIEEEIREKYDDVHKPIWQWIRKYPEIAERIKAKGYDSISQKETFTGKGKRQETLMILDEKIITKSKIVPEVEKEPWETSDLAEKPDIPNSYIAARKQPDGTYKLLFTGTRNEVFPGKKFRSAKEARSFFVAQKIKAKEATKKKAEPLSETKSRFLENIKAEKGSSELINDLSRLGADVMRRGHTTYKAFTAEMKTMLGDVWAKIKHFMKKAYFAAKKILKSERGAVEIGKKPKPETEYGRTAEVLKTATKEVKGTWDDIKKMADEYLGAISTRLANIDPSLRAHLRSFEYKAGTTKGKRIRQVQPLLEKIKSMSKEDRATFDLARKNADAKTLQRLIIKYNLGKEYKATRFLLNKMYTEAKGVGYKTGYRKHFHPRVIKDPKGFLEYLMDKEDWPLMDKAIKAREVQLGRYLEENEKAQVINSLLRGFGRDKIMLSIPGQLKERAIKTIWSELNKFYMDSDAALLRYIGVVTDAIEARKVFGVKRKEKKATSGTLENDINDTIGHYVLDLLAKGKIRPDQEHTLREIYQARFNEVSTRGVVGLYKNLSYIDTMGSPISAITQVGDLAWALYRAGIPKTFVATWKAVTGKSALKKEDLGIERIAQEFADTSKMARAVTKVFKIIGLEKIDNIGKEALVNAGLKKVQDRAKNPKKLNALWKKLEPTFGQETDALVDDFKNDRISENVKLYLFNTLLDFQPVALSEMPQKYLEGGNGRIFYMLKTFTLKQFDIYRREIFQQIGQPGTRLKGLKNLITLAACFVVANASADIIKSLILNRPIDPDDLTVDNLLRLLGISKFVTWKARQEGVGSAMVRQVAPPFKLMDALSKDIMRAGDEKGLETVASIPVIGKLYYWWFGRGAEKSERRKKRLESKKKPEGLKKGRLKGGLTGDRLKGRLK